MERSEDDQKKKFPPQQSKFEDDNEEISSRPGIVNPQPEPGAQEQFEATQPRDNLQRYPQSNEAISGSSISSASGQIIQQHESEGQAVSYGGIGEACTSPEKKKRIIDANVVDFNRPNKATAETSTADSKHTAARDLSAKSISKLPPKKRKLNPLEFEIPLEKSVQSSENTSTTQSERSEIRSSIRNIWKVHKERGEERVGSVHIQNVLMEHHMHGKKANILARYFAPDKHEAKEETFGQSPGLIRQQMLESEPSQNKDTRSEAVSDKGDTSSSDTKPLVSSGESFEQIVDYCFNHFKFDCKGFPISSKLDYLIKNESMPSTSHASSSGIQAQKASTVYTPDAQFALPVVQDNRKIVKFKEPELIDLTQPSPPATSVDESQNTSENGNNNSNVTVPLTITVSCQSEHNVAPIPSTVAKTESEDQTNENIPLNKSPSDLTSAAEDANIQNSKAGELQSENYKSIPVVAGDPNSDRIDCFDVDFADSSCNFSSNCNIECCEAQDLKLVEIYDQIWELLCGYVTSNESERIDINTDGDVCLATQHFFLVKYFSAMCKEGQVQIDDPEQEKYFQDEIGSQLDRIFEEMGESSALTKLEFEALRAVEGMFKVHWTVISENNDSKMRDSLKSFDKDLKLYVKSTTKVETKKHIIKRWIKYFHGFVKFVFSLDYQNLSPK